MHHLTGTERVFEDVIGLGEPLRDVAAADPRVERNVGAGPAGQVLEIGEHARRLQPVVNDRRVRPRGRHLVEHRLERLVLDLDQVRGLLGDVRVGGQGNGDGLAHVSNLAMRQNRLVVKCGTVVRMRHQLQDVFDGDDRVDAIEREGRAGINPHDAPVGHRAAADLAVQHAGQP